MNSILLCLALLFGDPQHGCGGVVQVQKQDKNLVDLDHRIIEEFASNIDSDSSNEEFNYPESNENISAIEVDTETFFLIINDSSLFQLSRSNSEWSFDFSTEIVDESSTFDSVDDNTSELLGPGDGGGGSVNCLKIDNNTVVCAFVNGENVRVIVMVRDSSGKWTIALDSGWNKEPGKQPKK